MYTRISGFLSSITRRVAIRQAALAIAGVAFAAATIAAPVSAAPIPGGVSNDSLLFATPVIKARSVKVRWAEKTRLYDHTNYTFTVTNTGIQNAGGASLYPQCWFHPASGADFGVHFSSASPAWLNSLPAGASQNFTFSCPNTHNGAQLDHSRGMATLFYNNGQAQVVEYADSN